MKSVLAACTLGAVAEALPFMRLFGIKVFQCAKDPATHDNFNVMQLEGKWHQVAANWGDNSFGCLTYKIIPDSDHKKDKAPDFMLEVDWTTYNTYWNPFELGEHTAKYNLKSKPNGQLKQKTFGINPTYSWVLATDYETYIVEYHCQ